MNTEKAQKIVENIDSKSMNKRPKTRRIVKLPSNGCQNLLIVWVKSQFSHQC